MGKLEDLAEKWWKAEEGRQAVIEALRELQAEHEKELGELAQGYRDAIKIHIDEANRLRARLDAAGGLLRDAYGGKLNWDAYDKFMNTPTAAGDAKPDGSRPCPRCGSPVSGLSSSTVCDCCGNLWNEAYQAGREFERKYGNSEPESPRCYSTACRFYGQLHATPHEPPDGPGPHRVDHRWKSGGAGGQSLESSSACRICGLPPSGHK